MTKKEIIDRISQLIDENGLEEWLYTYNDAFKQRPIVMLENEKGREKLEQMIYQIEMGEPL